MKRALLVLIIILAILFRVWASQPTWIQSDENYYINIYQNYVDRGELTPYMWRLGGDTNIIAGSGTGYGIFVLIGWMRIFGESLFGVRMLMVLAGLVTAWVYYLTAKKWWGSQEAGIAALVFGLVSTSAFYTLVGRMDAIGILSYSLLLLLHITAVRQEKKWPHFLVGAAAILTTEFHILGILYLGGLALYYFYEFVRDTLEQKQLSLNHRSVYFFVGAGLFGILYIIIHILPGPKTYLLIARSCAICQLGMVDTEIMRVKNLLTYRPHELLLLILTVYLVFKRDKPYRHYLILLGGYLVSQIIVSPPPNTQYFPHIMPLFSVGLAGAVQHLFSILKTAQKNRLITGFLVASLALLIVNVLSLATQHYPYGNAYLMPDGPEIEYIQENIPTSTVVMSTGDNFYPLKDYRNFLQYAANLEYGLTIRNESMSHFLERIDPKVIFIRGFESNTGKTLKKFVNRGDYVQVMPDLLVARELIPIE